MRSERPGQGFHRGDRPQRAPRSSGSCRTCSCWSGSRGPASRSSGLENDLQAVIAQACEVGRAAGEPQGRRLVPDLAETGGCEIDPHRLGQAVDNLLTNAVKFSALDGGRRRPAPADRRATPCRGRRPRDRRPEEEVDKLFDRLFRARERDRQADPGNRPRADDRQVGRRGARRLGRRREPRERRNEVHDRAAVLTRPPVTDAGMDAPDQEGTSVMADERRAGQDPGRRRRPRHPRAGRFPARAGGARDDARPRRGGGAGAGRARPLRRSACSTC